jgi:hypothetical protein
MLRKSLALLAFVASLGLATGTATAQVWACKICDIDAYGQNICVPVSSMGPEGGTICRAYPSYCVTEQPCNYWT